MRIFLGLRCAVIMLITGKAAWRQQITAAEDRVTTHMQRKAI